MYDSKMRQNIKSDALFVIYICVCIYMQGYDHVALHDRHLRERISLFKAAFKEDMNENDK